MDLYKNDIPGLCTGISLDIEDVGQSVSKEKYPLITRLLERGIAGLFDLDDGLGLNDYVKGRVMVNSVN